MPKELFQSVLELIKPPMENRDHTVRNIQLEIIERFPLLVVETGDSYYYEFPDLERQLAPEISDRGIESQYVIQVDSATLKLLRVPYVEGKWYIDIALDRFSLQEVPPESLKEKKQEYLSISELKEFQKLWVCDEKLTKNLGVLDVYSTGPNSQLNLSSASVNNNNSSQESRYLPMSYFKKEET